MRAGPDGAASAASVSAIIPCLDEEDAIAAVVAAVRAQCVEDVIVVDGGSRDATIERARAAGARVVVEEGHGYGRAVQAGIAALPPRCDTVLFLDGDGSDRAEFIPQLLAPIASDRAVFVHGSRTRGDREAGSLSLPQRIAGHLAGFLIRQRYGARFTDMSPFRAIRRDALESLGMRETGYGWNLEMLMRVAAAGLPAVEVATGQRRRAGGVSKVSGNVGTGLHAAWSIGATFLRLAATLRRERHQ
ncbi:MAG: glycosyltransferase family 2 protein [Proteobacteria bacterium]|nr:glycosyltransferase family 2 protein [Pseudomonadota bacterium]